jgi:hypothetical protein
MAMAVVALTPAAASAQWLEIMEWIERLSGPRFRGVLFDVPLVCVPQGGGVGFGACHPVDADDRTGALGASDRKLVFGVRFGRHFSGVSGFSRGDNNLPYPEGTSDQDKNIDQTTAGGFVSWQPHRAVDIVVAVEGDRFTGPRVPDPFWIAVISPGVAWKPFAHFSTSRWARIVKIPIRIKRHLGTITSEQFGALPGFVSRDETVLAYGIAIDWPFSY